MHCIIRLNITYLPASMHLIVASNRRVLISWSTMRFNKHLYLKLNKDSLHYTNYILYMEVMRCMCVRCIVFAKIKKKTQILWTFPHHIILPDPICANSRTSKYNTTLYKNLIFCITWYYLLYNSEIINFIYMLLVLEFKFLFKVKKWRSLRFSSEVLLVL